MYTFYTLKYTFNTHFQPVIKLSNPDFCRVKSAHIGQKVKEISKREGYTAEAFGKLINKTRDGVNKIFKKKYLDTELLQTISNKLKHDFFAYLSHDLGLAKEPGNNFGLASKDELSRIYLLLEKLDKRMDELESRIPVKPLPKYKAAPKKRGKKGS